MISRRLCTLLLCFLLPGGVIYWFLFSLVHVVLQVFYILLTDRPFVLTVIKNQVLACTSTFISHWVNVGANQQLHWGVCACVCKCSRVYMCVCVYKCVHVCVCVCLSVHVWVCLSVCMYVCVHDCVHMCSYVHVYVHMFACMCVCVTCIYILVMCVTHP